MSRIRTLSVAALVMALAVTVSSVRAADAAKKTDAAIHGVVTAIDKDAKTFTVKVEARKAKNADAATAEEAKTMTFKVDDKTVFTKVARKKKGDAAEPEAEAATFADLNDKGKQRVTVESTEKDGKLIATSVKIVVGKKKAA